MTSGGGKRLHMTPDEYRELVDFLGRKFDRIDQRFDQVDQRFEQVDQRFERVDQRFERVDQRFENVEGEIRGVRVLVEKNASDIRKVAEGVQVANDRLERFQAEVREEFADVRQEMKWGFDGIHARVDRVEDAMTQDRAGRRG
jgi:archaellum component FlaC